MMKKLKALAFVLALAAWTTIVEAQIPSSEYAARRAALAQKLGSGILVALGNPEPEEDFLSFNQNSNFKYLTDFHEPDAALVMVIRNGAIVGSPLLFVQPSDPAREVWTGRRLGIPGVKSTFGMEGRDAATLAKVVDSLAALDQSGTLYTVGRFNPPGELSTRDDQIIGTFLKSNTRLSAKNANDD